MRRDVAPSTPPAQGQARQAGHRAAGAASEKGVSREELARVAGTSASGIARLESGKEANPPLRILNNCAIALGVQLDAVIDPEWRTWWNRYGGQELPPEPDEFWHQPGRGTSES